MAKWGSNEGLKPGEVPSDAITGDLRTQNNRISLWKCLSQKQKHIEQIALAIVASGDYINRVELALIPADLLLHNPDLHDTEGRTPYRKLASEHCELTSLDGVRLVQVARLIADSIGKKLTCTIPKRRLMEITRNAIEQGHIDPADLSDELRKRVSFLNQ
ncbi:MAG: hypothetical protein OXC81_05505 [Betaproteobacteria bacterium]|nr:hypothetical protein [Betaproteobacteria bacterium]